MAARVAYSLATSGPIPRPLVVAHSCDNPPCCNPAHLSAKTQRANTLEAVQRGQLSYDSPRYLATRVGWWRHGKNGRGVNNANAKLTDDDVRRIRKALTSGTRQVDIARQFGVGQSTISRINRSTRTETTP